MVIGSQCQLVLSLAAIGLADRGHTKKTNNFVYINSAREEGGKERDDKRNPEVSSNPKPLPSTEHRADGRAQATADE